MLFQREVKSGDVRAGKTVFGGELIEGLMGSGDLRSLVVEQCFQSVKPAALGPRALKLQN